MGGMEGRGIPNNGRRKPLDGKLIEKDDPRWESLYRTWVEEKKPGYVVTVGGASYRVLQPSDEEVKFQPMGSMDEMYGSRSTGLLGR